MSKWNVKHINSCTKTWLSVFYFYNGQVMKWFATGLQAQHMNLDYVSLKNTQQKYLLQWPTVAHEVLVFDSIFTSSTNMTIIFWLKDPAQFRFLAILIIHYFSVRWEVLKSMYFTKNFSRCYHYETVVASARRHMSTKAMLMLFCYLWLIKNWAKTFFGRVFKKIKKNNLVRPGASLLFLFGYCNKLGQTNI